MKKQEPQVTQEQQQAIGFLINVAELAQKQGMFSLNDAKIAIQAIRVLEPLMTQE